MSLGIATRGLFGVRRGALSVATRGLYPTLGEVSEPPVFTTPRRRRGGGSAMRVVDSPLRWGEPQLDLRDDEAVLELFIAALIDSERGS